jgi:hypothetical protein
MTRPAALPGRPSRPVVFQPLALVVAPSIVLGRYGLPKSARNLIEIEVKWDQLSTLQEALVQIWERI